MAALEVAGAATRLVGSVFGSGGNPWDKSKDETQAAGHAAAKGDVTAIDVLVDKYVRTKYKKVREVARNYLVACANGNAYDGKKTVVVSPQVKAAAQAAVEKLAIQSRGVSGLTIPPVNTIGNGVARSDGDTSNGWAGSLPSNVFAATETGISMLPLVLLGVGAFFLVRNSKLLK